MPLSVSAGKVKGKKLKVPASARPISANIKRSVFDILGDRVEGNAVLDLFAGAGNMGIEALSRGAAKATFVDTSQEATKAIQQNLIATGLNHDTKIIRSDVNRFLRSSSWEFDLIFMDPPFAFWRDFHIGYLKRAMKPDALAIIRRPLEVDVRIPKDLELIHEQRYGGSKVMWLQRIQETNDK